ncbi:MAG: response regulator [Anaerolineales bacterium]|nr:response regulator [Anaerolineales bacterium]
MDKIKVLVVDDNVAAADNLAKLLQFENDIEVVDRVHTGEEAISSYESSSPDVVLMDRGLPEMDGFQATATIKKLDKFAQVILISIEPGTDHARRAIKCGATDFLTSPISPDLLVSAIREAAEKRVPPAPPDIGLKPDRRPLGKIISLYSGKGGVGCTIIATNLAVALHSDETPCVLVDADLQFGDVPVAFNLQAHFSIADVAVHGEGLDEELLQEILLTHESGLRILAAPPRPEMADEIEAESFSHVLELLKRLFAYVVIDTASYLDGIALAALEASDQILLVLSPDIPSIKNARAFLDTLRELGIPHERVGLILSQVRKGDPIRSEQVTQSLRQEVLVEIPYDREGVKTAINRGKPLLIDRKTHPLTKPLLELVGIVREQLIVLAE